MIDGISRGFNLVFADMYTIRFCLFLIRVSVFADCSKSKITVTFLQCNENISFVQDSAFVVLGSIYSLAPNSIHKQVTVFYQTADRSTILNQMSQYSANFTISISLV